MTVTVKGSKLTVEMDLIENPLPSKSSGKTLVVASTGGFVPTTVKVNGQPLKLSITGVTPIPAAS